MEQIHLSQLCQPRKLWRRSELLTRPSPVPKTSGIYAWYFREIPVAIPTFNCVRHGEFTLLYLGIAPKGPGSNRTLRHRLREHLAGNAFGSTVRLSLGCLLEEKLGIELQKVGKYRLTFLQGEATLSQWMEENARIVWSEHSTPWEIEAELVQILSVPLNLEHNQDHPFYSILAAKRTAARSRARGTLDE